MIPRDYITELVQRSDIVDVVQSYVQLRHRGRTHTGLCPFHNEKTPSFVVYPETQSFYCFGCGAGGDVITFIKKINNVDYIEAVKFLAGRAGMALPEEDDQTGRLRSRIISINKDAARFYFSRLNSDAGRVGRAYWRGRGLSDATIKRFGLGYAPDSFRETRDHLKSLGYTEDELLAAGLIKRSEKGGTFDFFRHRVMIPIFDLRGNVIAFSGRKLDPEQPGGKYVNSPETLVYKKSRTLFALNFAKKSQTRRYILCEGNLDAISMHQAGFTQAVASLGTAFTAGQANMLRRYAREVILAYDSDGAGVNAALRAIGILKEVELTGKVLNLEPYKDPDEFIKNEGAEKFQQRINEAENSFFFELRILQRDYNLKDPESKTQFHREIAKKLCEFSEDVERDNYIQAVADKYLIGYENLRKLVMSYALKTGNVQPVVRPKSGIQPKNTPDENRRKPQKLFLTWLVEEPQLYPRVKQYISVEDFTEELYRKVAERLFEDLDKGEINPAAIVSLFNDMEEQREVAGVFNTKLQEITTKQDRHPNSGNIHFECEDIDTINGYMIYKLGKIPEEQEQFQMECGGYLFDVAEVADKMIRKVRVTKIQEKEQKTENE